MVQTLLCRWAALSPEDDVRVIRVIGPSVLPAPSSCVTPSESSCMPVVCRDLDVGLNSLTEDVADILSEPWVPCDMSTLLTACDTNRVYVSLAPSYAPTEDLNDIIFYENERGYAKVADAIVDDCYIYFYRGTLYNIPADNNAPPPFTCITSGHYIGVFSGEDYVPMVKGITNTVYFKVESLEVGERALRNAIEQSDIVRFPVPSQ
ncbi:hypothetical protein EV702DRAFT_1199617 [Suillus placidus]|uniref:Uncharacterized protein n=1 Tax=Suillus placidus TaxID=48579 RepID=A0A9P6ZRB7_9AGAM|nr:hypothetical protein EV702DRAFT_1199617 [Suillus placidus]